MNPVNRLARFLMDQEEGNLGSEQSVKAKPVGEIGQGFPSRIFDFNGDSKFGNVLTIAIAAFWKSGNANPNFQGLGGPIVATVEFGNGGAFTKIDVDIPFGSARNFGGPPTKDPNLEDGIILTLPASSVRVIARNDGAVIPVDSSDLPIGDERLDGLPAIASPNPADNEASTMIVKAFIVKGTRASIAGPHRLFPLASYVAATPVIAGYRIPPFAKFVRFLRDPNTAPVTYVFQEGNSGHVLDNGAIPAGTSSPVIPVPTQANLLTFGTGIVGVTRAWADYELEA